jgi:hypothetical protein
MVERSKNCRLPLEHFFLFFSFGEVAGYIKKLLDGYGNAKAEIFRPIDSSHGSRLNNSENSIAVIKNCFPFRQLGQLHSAVITEFCRGFIVKTAIRAAEVLKNKLLPAAFAEIRRIIICSIAAGALYHSKSRFFVFISFYHPGQSRPYQE